MNVVTNAGRRTRRLVKLGIANAGPGWFTSIMGTGILAICLTISPIPVPVGRQAGVALWTAATLLFGLYLLFWTIGALHHPTKLAATFHDPAKAQQWGGPPMACFTIAVGFLKIGSAILPLAWCVGAAQTLFVAGVAGSLFSVFLIPYLMFTRHELRRDQTYGSWLLPVVPPIVASVPAALLCPTWPAAYRADILAFAYALLGIGMMLAAIIIVIFYSRLLYDKVPAAPLVPTLWIVVGPLGQSIAGMIALGTAAETVWPAIGHGLLVAAVAYGVLAWGFAMYWLTLAVLITVRTARERLPFTLGWWAFTFPVGVLTAGTDALYGQTHAGIFAATAVGLVALLTAMWTLVATETVRNAAATAMRSGRLQPFALSPAA